MWPGNQTQPYPQLNPFEELKSSVMKLKSTRPKQKDIDYIINLFEKYFNAVKSALNSDKIIQYYIEVFICGLGLVQNERVSEGFKKLVGWLGEHRNSKNGYYLVKIVVEICQREFTENKLYQNAKEEKNEKQEIRQEKKKQERSQSKQRQIGNSSRDRRQKSKQKQQQNLNIYTKQNLKKVLTLVRKAGEKYMLDIEIYQILLEYYLERIGGQVEEYVKHGGMQRSRGGMLDEKRENQGGKIEFGSHVLSELSTILASKYKNTAVATIQRFINMSTGNNIFSHISIYLLLETKNIPWVLAQLDIPVSSNAKMQNSGSRIRYHGEIYKLVQNGVDGWNAEGGRGGKGETVFAYLVRQIVGTLGKCLKNINFSTIANLYQLFPGQGSAELTNSEHLLEKLFICQGVYCIKTKPEEKPSMSNQQWDIWFKQFLEYHRQYIQSTKLQKPEDDKNTIKKFLDIRYVIKLYLIGIWLLNPMLEKTRMNQDMKSILAVLMKQLPKDRKKMQCENRQRIISCYDDRLRQFWILFQDGYFMLFMHRSMNSIEKQNIYLVEGPGSNLSKLQLHVQRLGKWKLLVTELADTYKDKDDERKGKKLAGIAQLVSHGHRNDLQPALFEEWRIAMQAMFELIIGYYGEQESKEVSHQEVLYSKPALFALQVLTIKPPVIRQSRGSNIKLFVSCELQDACMDIIQMIVSSVDRQEMVDQIKKLMSQFFDRVFPDIIRNKIARSLFLCRCLLMTNHNYKCRVLVFQLLRQYDMGDNHIGNMRGFLQKLLVAVPEEILIQFCRFVARKDKLQFRMLLYEKEMQHLDYLTEVGLFSLTSRNYAHQGKL